MNRYPFLNPSVVDANKVDVLTYATSPRTGPEYAQMVLDVTGMYIPHAKLTDVSYVSMVSGDVDVMESTALNDNIPVRMVMVSSKHVNIAEVIVDKHLNKLLAGLPVEKLTAIHIIFHEGSSLVEITLTVNGKTTSSIRKHLKESANWVNVETSVQQ